MAHSIEEIRDPAGGIGEIARFLADFVADGELPNASLQDADEGVWKRRLHDWWIANPFCSRKSPLGLMLRDSHGRLCGFHGFIPHDYRIGSRIVPALIATTFFVREHHRQAALGMLVRLKRFAADFHLVDGSPSPEVQLLLERFRFRKCAPGVQYYRIVGRRHSWSPKAMALNLAAWLWRDSGEATGEPLHFVEQPEAIGAVPAPTDEVLRKVVSREGLVWFMNTGSTHKIFRGLCDAQGTLRAYFIGIPKTRIGLHSLRIVESCSFDSDGSALKRLLHRAANHPAAAAPDLLIIANLDSAARREPRWSLARPWQTPLFFQIPPALAGTPKCCQPSEGDSLLL